MKIAVIGQGYVGGAYSKWFESKGHKVTRYGLEPQFADNRARVAEARMVIVAVPTPTGPDGQDSTAVREAVALAGPDATVVIKSTVLPGTTDDLARARSERGGVGGITLVSPEFLRSDHALEDVQKPHRTVIGIPDGTEDGDAIKEAIAVLPTGRKLFKCSARTAEFIKYAANIMLISKLVVANALYDAKPRHTDWVTVERALEADPRLGPSHLAPSSRGKRGAGGPCFIKDFAAFNQHGHSSALLDLIEDANLHLLRSSGKDLDIIAEVFGEGMAA